jgi:tellurite methyltransferase
MERMAKDGGMPMEGKPGDWPAYFDAVAGLPPRETLLAAMERFEREGAEATRGQGAKHAAVPLTPRYLDTVTPLAVDLGCGEGRDTLELLRRGWRVLAVDSHPEAISRLRTRVSGPEADRLETLIGRFEEVPVPRCDLVNASFSIPHCAPADFPPMWARIVDAIKAGGRFAGQFFGVRDEWASKPDGVTRTYHTREQVEAMLGPFEIEMLDEIERPGKTALGEPKYWHVFHVVARKR